MTTRTEPNDQGKIISTRPREGFSATHKLPPPKKNEFFFCFLIYYSPESVKKMEELGFVARNVMPASDLIFTSK